MYDPLTFYIKVDEYNDYPKKMREAITIGLRNTALYMRERWIEGLNRWGLELYGIARNSIIVEQQAPNIFVVRSNGSAPYLVYHEYGAGVVHEGEPHNQYWPNKAKIMQWVIDRGLRWTDAKGKEMSVEQMTFLIQQKQYKYGLEPKPAARPAYEDAMRQARHFINDAMVKRFVK